jgi:hypothetical protein
MSKYKKSSAGVSYCLVRDRSYDRHYTDYEVPRPARRADRRSFSARRDARETNRSESVTSQSGSSSRVRKGSFSNLSTYRSGSPYAYFLCRHELDTKMLDRIRYGCKSPANMASGTPPSGSSVYRTLEGTSKSHRTGRFPQYTRPKGENSILKSKYRQDTDLLLKVKDSIVLINERLTEKIKNVDEKLNSLRRDYGTRLTCDNVYVCCCKRNNFKADIKYEDEDGDDNEQFDARVPQKKVQFSNDVSAVLAKQKQSDSMNGSIKSIDKTQDYYTNSARDFCNNYRKQKNTDKNRSDAQQTCIHCQWRHVKHDEFLCRKCQDQN